MACWCYLPRQSSMWNCIREKSWTSWSSDGYDAGTSHSPVPGSPADTRNTCPYDFLCNKRREMSFLLRFQCHSLPITKAVPGLSVWTGNGRGGAGSDVHVYLVAISCDVICNSQSEPVQAESSLVCSEEITVFQWRENVWKKKKNEIWDLFCNIIIIIIILMIMIINILN